MSPAARFGALDGGAHVADGVGRRGTQSRHPFLGSPTGPYQPAGGQVTHSWGSRPALVAAGGGWFNGDMEYVWPFIALGIMVAVGIGLFAWRRWQRQLDERCIREWADSQGYGAVSIRSLGVWAGMISGMMSPPLWLFSSGNAWEVTVEDQDRGIFTGWAVVNPYKYKNPNHGVTFSRR